MSLELTRDDLLAGRSKPASPQPKKRFGPRSAADAPTSPKQQPESRVELPQIRVQASCAGEFDQVRQQLNRRNYVLAKIHTGLSRQLSVISSIKSEMVDVRKSVTWLRDSSTQELSDAKERITKYMPDPAQEEREIVQDLHKAITEILQHCDFNLSRLSEKEALPLDHDKQQAALAAQRSGDTIQVHSARSTSMSGSKSGTGGPLLGRAPPPTEQVALDRVNPAVSNGGTGRSSSRQRRMTSEQQISDNPSVLDRLFGANSWKHERSSLKKVVPLATEVLQEIVCKFDQVKRSNDLMLLNIQSREKEMQSICEEMTAAQESTTRNFQRLFESLKTSNQGLAIATTVPSLQIGKRFDLVLTDLTTTAVSLLNRACEIRDRKCDALLYRMKSSANTHRGDVVASSAESKIVDESPTCVKARLASAEARVALWRHKYFRSLFQKALLHFRFRRCVKFILNEGIKKVTQFLVENQWAAVAKEAVSMEASGRPEDGNEGRQQQRTAIADDKAPTPAAAASVSVEPHLVAKFSYSESTATVKDKRLAAESELRRHLFLEIPASSQTFFGASEKLLCEGESSPQSFCALKGPSKRLDLISQNGRRTLPPGIKNSKWTAAGESGLLPVSIPEEDRKPTVFSALPQRPIAPRYSHATQSAANKSRLRPIVSVEPITDLFGAENSPRGEMAPDQSVRTPKHSGKERGRMFPFTPPVVVRGQRADGSHTARTPSRQATSMFRRVPIERVVQEFVSRQPSAQAHFE